MLNSLQGKVPGAQITQNSGDPAGSISVRLRGVHSLRGSSDPLYVIDGVIVSNASTNVSQLAVSNDIGAANAGQNRLADLNPNDIASINVINGAAAAAQYGSRAANGVVLITTKRGQAGAPRGYRVSTSFNLQRAAQIGAGEHLRQAVWLCGAAALHHRRRLGGPDCGQPRHHHHVHHPGQRWPRRWPPTW